MGIIIQNVVKNGRTCSVQVDSSPPDHGQSATPPSISPIPTMSCGCPDSGPYRNLIYSPTELTDQIKNLNRRMCSLWNKNVEYKRNIDAMQLKYKNEKLGVYIGLTITAVIVTVFLMALFWYLCEGSTNA